MARLRAQEKMEFYPTVMDDIENALSSITATVQVRALDPSAGDGRTLKALKEKFKADVYGVELDHNRVEQTADVCGPKKALWADALLEARISPRAFNLIFLNPPYDNISAYGHQRLELSFIEKYSPVLCPGGFMILVVSESLLNYSRETNESVKKSIFTDFYILDAFKSVDDTFNQWILILKKKKNPRLPQEYSNKIEEKSYWNWDYQDMKNLQDESFNYKENYKMPYSLDAEPDELKVFSSYRLSKEDILKASAANKRKIDQILTVLKPQDKFKTLLPLKKSHITLLLTTGGLNGRIEGTPFVINGQIDRSVLSNTETEIGEDGEEKTTEIKISKFTPKVSIMRLDTPEHPIIELN